MESKRSNCKHLTHKYTSFNGCTVQEAFMIAGVLIFFSLAVNVPCSVFLASYLGGFVGAFLLGSLLMVPLVFFGVKKTTLKIGKIRKGRPAGFVQFKISKFINEIFGVPIPYITRNGAWLRRKTIK